MERIHVAVRARPLSPEDSKTSPWRVSGNSISLANQPTKFEFDRIFGEECKTVDVYEAWTKDIVASVVRGFNGTVFAYGQTNSGKTHTMRGSISEPGVIPLAVHDLFRSIQEDVEREFLLRMSYMEIYNEEINDLLAPEHRKLQIHESLERGIYVAGLREEIVACPEQVLDLMEFGESHRHIGETNMNLYSSRSHTIFRMIVESREKIEDGNIADSCDAVRVSVLNLVDLAGSERAAKTGAEGMRLKEGSHINKSLMTLGSVIKKLSEGAESQGGHVPYRDSKLTRILQPALGGNANTAIICNITLAQVHTDETKSSLQFASRALRVKNCAFVNEILTDAALLKRQRKEIQELREKMLASHSEHWEEEILNLRNTLLQSELEKERIALELEEEKKAKAQRERRLIEQAKKIANLSSLVLFSERDEKSSYLSKNKRRVTWCPGPFSQKCANEMSASNQVATIRDPVRDERDMSLPLPFRELMQESEAVADGVYNETCLPDNSEHCDNCDDFPLPDAQALLHVTSRRKVNCSRTGSQLESNESATKQSYCDDQFSEYDSQSKAKNVESMESECTPSRIRISSSVSTPFSGLKILTIRESEAIAVIKQLEDQIKSLEMEKAAIQRDLDNVVDLATEQNASFREKYEELHNEVATAQEEARLAHEQLHSVASIGALSKEFTADSSIDLSKEILGLVSEVNRSVSMVDNFPSVIEDFFQNVSILSEMLLELKSFMCQDTVQFSSIISGHKKICGCMRKRIDELEFEKDLLHKQFVDHQKQINELKSDRDKLEKEGVLQHDMEKDELLSQILGLQKELSFLSSSSLAREKETLRKELDKTKSKLKDTESKLKNTIQDKIKLESEKAQVERELKHLHGQRSLLERDIRKRDSILDKRRESRSSDLSKTRAIAEQALQDEYNKLEVRAFEMEAEITSLKEALMAAIGEKEEAYANIEVLDSELEIMSNKLTTAHSERRVLEEEVANMTKHLDESDSCSKNLEALLDSMSREKEEMAMQLTDALLEAEAEKSTWLAKEKAFINTCERVKTSNDEIVRLSEDLSEVRHQLESCREESRMLKERLAQKECRMAETSKFAQLTNEPNQNTVNRAEFSDINSNFELLTLEHRHACEEVQKLQENLCILTQERDKLSLQVNQLSNARSDVEGLAERVAIMEVNMHNEALEHNKEKTRLRMRLRSTQAKLDAFRGRYKDLADELGLMNRKYEEASTKLKEQLVSYGHEILRLKKQLTTQQ